jgi:PAS domain S-box-containing protein
MASESRTHPSILDVSPELVARFSSDGRILDCNATALRTLGYERDALLSLSIFDIDTAANAGILKTARQAIIEQGSITFETRYRSQSGESFPVEVVVAPVNDGSGDLVAFARNIERRRARQHQLSLLKSDFEAIFDRSPVPHVIQDDSWAIIAVNQAYCQLLGYGPDELVGRDPAEFARHRRPDLQVGGGSRRMLLDDPDAKHEFSVAYRHRDGREIPTRVTTRVLKGERLRYLSTVEDRSSQEGAEGQLKRSLAVQSALIETSAAGIIHMRGGLIVMTNRTFDAMFGYEAGELVGKYARQLYAGTDLESLAMQARTTTAAGVRWTQELELTRRDGSKIWCFVDGAKIDPQDPDAGGVYTVTDITHYHVQQARLTQALAEQQLVFDSLSVGVAVLESGVIRQSNRQMAVLLGQGPSTLDGQPYAAYFVERDGCEDFLTRLRTVVDRQAITRFEAWIKRPDGEQRWILSFGRKLSAANAAILIVAVDLTEQRAQSAALTAAQLEIEATYDGTAIGLAFSRHGMIVRCNRRFEEILGYGAGELVGMVGSRAFFFSDEQFEHISKSVTAALEQDGQYQSEEEVRRKDGQRTWVQITIRVLDRHNIALGRVLSMSDISESIRQREATALAHLEQVAIFESAAAGIVFTRDRKVVRVNRRAELIVGAAPGGLIGLDTRTFYGSDFAHAAAYEAFFRAIAAEEVWTIELELRRLDGTFIWAQVSSVPLDRNDVSRGIVSSVHDITASKRQQRAIEQALFEQALVLEGMQIGTAIMRDRIITDCNAQFGQLFGYLPEELVGKSTRLLYADTEEFLAAGERVSSRIAVAGSFSGDIKYRDRQGREVIGHAVGKQLMREGAPAVVIAVRDVTDERQREGALADMRQFLATVVDNLPVSLVVKDAHDLRILSMNRVAEQIFGLDRNEVIGRRGIEVFPNQGGAAAQERDLQALAQRREVKLQGGIKHPRTGEWRTLITTSVPVHGYDGEAQYVITLGEDVSDQVAQQAALNESEARFRKFAEVIDEIIFVVDAGANQSFYVSERFKDVWGGDIDQVRGSPQQVMAALAPRARRQAELAFRRAQRLLPSEGEVQIRHPVKGERWIRVKTMPSMTESGDVRVFGVAEDVTERKAEAERRFQVQRQQLDTLVREVHHRIKNNLQGVAGLIQQMAYARPEVADSLHEIASQIHAIAGVHGLQVRSPDPLSIDELVVAVVENQGRLSNATLVLGIERNDNQRFLLPEAEAVPVALVVNELITNAIKHCRSPDKSIAVRLQRQGASVVFRVSGEGQLPDGFVYEQLTTGVSGLSLVKALLPRRGAKLSLSQLGNEVVAVLELTEPALRVG